MSSLEAGETLHAPGRLNPSIKSAGPDGFGGFSLILLAIHVSVTESRRRAMDGCRVTMSDRGA
jgi:hypothetical protein